MTRILFGVLAVFISVTLSAHGNRIDIIRHDAPELAHFGNYNIGVRTLELTDPDRPDILNTVQGGNTAYYDRKLTVEIWYPAQLEEGQQPGVDYTTTTRNLAVTAILHGRAVRNAAPSAISGALPLVIISHGYPGNRYLMSHLGENLASKGYVVVAIDHRDSTYVDQQAIASTLYNRPLDQLFILDQMATLSDDGDSFLHGMVDAENTGIVGYSMGGYGLLINLGSGYSDKVATSEFAPPNGLATRHAATNPEFNKGLDSRIKAGFAIAPWGMAAGVWKPEALQRMTAPVFYLAGSADATAGYEDGIRVIFESATQSDRYLLTYVNAGHNAGAPIPVPIEILNREDQAGADHYTDSVWDSVRMNNIMDHFAAAFFDYQLKGNAKSLTYLQLRPDTDWKGFGERNAHGLLIEHLAPAQ